jgi:hypothetical protein
VNRPGRPSGRLHREAGFDRAQLDIDASLPEQTAAARFEQVLVAEDGASTMEATVSADLDALLISLYVLVDDLLPALTERGEALEPVLKAIGDWSRPPASSSTAQAAPSPT